MNILVFEELYKKGLINEETLQNIKNEESKKQLNVSWELKTLLYLGILFFTTGAGIIIFKNLATIGHLAIVIFIGLATLFCYAFCFKKAPPFTIQKVTTSNVLQDYVLLSGCLLMLIFTGYLQFQYQLFGDRWGLATFIPMVILFISAYYFDHLGVLSLAIVNFAAWAGITVTPLRVLKDNNFNDENIIFTAYLLGVLLSLLAWVSQQKNIKAHFYFTYKNFGTHFLFISAIAAIIHFTESYLFWFLPLACVAYYHFSQSLKELSFYFFVITALYAYAGFSYILMKLLFTAGFNEGMLYIALFYFIGSGVALAYLLMRYNKIIKKI